MGHFQQLFVCLPESNLKLLDMAKGFLAELLESLCVRILLARNPYIKLVGGLATPLKKNESQLG